MIVKKRSELKALALQHLRGNWGKAIGACVIVFLISGIISLLDQVDSSIAIVGSLLTLVLTGPLTAGLVIFFLKLIRNGSPKVSDVFSGFQRFGSFLALYLLTVLFIFLWVLLLIIPGIIAAYRYSQVFYIMADNPEISAMEALRRSKEMMRGHKWRLFVLYLSFIGWFLLCIVTLGIGFLWLSPYASATIANFYEDLRIQHSQQPQIQ